jgi:hypothetical protein
MGYVHDQRGDMKKAPSTILATAGLTVGMLGFALPAGAATAAPSPHNPITLPTGHPTTPVTLPTGHPTTPVTLPTGHPTTPVTLPTGHPTTPVTLPTGHPTTPVTLPTGHPTTPVTQPTGHPTKPSRPVGHPTKPADPGYPGKGGVGGGKTPPKQHPKPLQHPKPKPTATCHPQAPKPKPPAKPIGYNKGSNKYKAYTAALYSWEHPKSGHTVKCDPKPVKHPAPVKHPVKHPAPSKHHHAPKKHWWNLFG